MTTSPAHATDLLLDSAPDDADALLATPALAMRRRMTYQMQSPVLVCTECGREIAGRACPHCTRPKTVTLQNVQVLFATLFAVAFLAKVFVLFLS